LNFLGGGYGLVHLLRNALLLFYGLGGHHFSGVRLINFNNSTILLHYVFLSNLLDLNLVLVVFWRNMGSSSNFVGGVVHSSHHVGLAMGLLAYNVVGACNTLFLVNVGGHWGGELSVHVGWGVSHDVFGLGNNNRNRLVYGLNWRLNILTLNSGLSRLLVIVNDFVLGQVSSGSVLIKDISAHGGRIGISKGGLGGWVALYVAMSLRLNVTVGVGLVHVSSSWLLVAVLGGSLSFGWETHWRVALNHWSGVLLHPRVLLDKFLIAVYNSGVFHRGVVYYFNWGGVDYMLYWRWGVDESLDWLLDLVSDESGSQILISVEKSSNGLAKVRVVSVSTIEILLVLVESVPVKLSVLLITVLNGILSSELEQTHSQSERIIFLIVILLVSLLSLNFSVKFWGHKELLVVE